MNTEQSEATIRSYAAEDLPAIKSITMNGWAGYTVHQLIEQRHGEIGGRSWAEWKTDSIVDFCGKHPDLSIVAVVDGKIAGYAAFQTNDETGIGTVMNNAVSPDYRGRGIGTALNIEILTLLKQAGMKIARVSTLDHDAPAKRIYEKNGFREITKTVHYTMEL
jgi:ribosomal protein S18 acetylase RimI-like enzyme